MRIRPWLLGGLLGLAILGPRMLAAATATRVAPIAPGENVVLPLLFEANRGQAVSSARFIARAAGYRVAVGDREIALALDRSAVRLEFAGASRHARAEGLEPHPGVVSYFRGREPSRWVTSAPTFGRVSLNGLYKGINVELYGAQRRLEFDVVVAPGGNPADVRLALRGHSAAAIAPDGDLVVTAGGRTIRLSLPAISQVVDGRRVAVAGTFVVRGDEVSFSVPSYDRSRSLRIDPVVLGPSTYLGGTGFDEATAVSVDAGGYIYVFGSTSSLDFPVAGGAQAHDNVGYEDAFVAKLAPDGNSLIYATYLGGSESDYCNAGTIDPQGNAYLTGWTLSDTDFPVTVGAFQTSYGGDGPFYIGDAFVAKLAPSGTSLLYASYLGGSSEEHSTGIAADAGGYAYVSGWTMSWDFPTTPGTFKGPMTFGTLSEGFITKVDPTGSAMVYSSCIGGTAILRSYSVRGVAVDAAGSAYVACSMESSDFPTTRGAFQSIGAGGHEVMVAKVNAAGSALEYATYLGGSGDESAAAIAVDGAGNAYVAGSTASADFPTRNPIKPAPSGNPAFVSKLNPAGTDLVYSTFLGGSGWDPIRAITVDSLGRAHIAGETTSRDLPLKNAVQQTRSGSSCIKTQDGGDHWAQTGLGDSFPRHLVINPAAPGRLFAGTWGEGLLVTTDGGASWQSTPLGGQIFSIAYVPTIPDLLWAATANGIFVSSDGAATWQQRNNPGGYLAQDLVVDPKQPATAWATANTVYKTTNGGSSWSPTSLSGIGTLAIDPVNSLVVYAGGSSVGLFKTTDGGTAWAGSGLTSVDIQHIVIDPSSPQTVYVVAGGGPYKSTDGGTTWNPINAGLPQDVSVALAIDPQNGSTLYVAGSGRVFKSTDGGASWTDLKLAGLNLDALVVDPTDPDTVYVSAFPGHTDAFVSVLKASGSGLVLSTYLGGLDYDVAQGVAAADGATWVVGRTGYGFPVAGALQPEPAGGSEAFVARLSGEGDECVLDCTASVPGEARLGDPVGFQATTHATACSGSATVGWDFGDGTGGTGADVSHAYALPGTYVWHMNATTAGDSCTVSGTITIYTCELSCSATVPAGGLRGGSLTFAGAASAPRCDGSPSIRWAFGDGSAPSTETSPAHAYASVGSYGWTMLAAVGSLTCLQSGTVAIAAQETQAVLADGFEGEFPGAWTVKPDGGTVWGPSTFRASEGNRSAYCAGGGNPIAPPGGPYFLSMSTALVYGPFSLEGATAAKVTFSYWMQTELRFDWFSWMVSDDGLNFTGTSSSGATSGWETKEVDLASAPTAVLGQPQVWFEFLFESDASIQKEGVYVDAVRIEKTVPAPPGCTVICAVDAPPSALVGVAAPFAATAALSGCAGVTAYSWSFGDGTPPATQQNPAHTYGSAGVHLWQVTATANGSSCGKSGIVEVAMPPIVPVRRHLRH